MTTDKRYGAESISWFILSDCLGLGDDLLPVVCNPNAEVAPTSNLKDYRKTPSMYNADGKVVGIHQWTKREVTPEDIERWSKVPDYGICIRGRQVKAIDIDIEDKAVARDVCLKMMELLGIPYRSPVRFREGTGKCLIPVRCEGLVLKDAFDCTRGGIVELLGDRQQFVAIGTHKSGTQYQWDGSLGDLPTVTSKQLLEAWDKLKDQYAVEGRSRRSNVTERSIGENVEMEDALADFVVDNGLVVADRADGGYDVACPWVHEHSDGGADGGLAAFWPAGKNGILRSGFCCLHAHCSGRDVNDYAEAVGFTMSQFEVVEPESTELDVLGGIDRDKNGLAHANLPNLSVILSRPQLTGYKVAKDTFLGEIVVCTADGCKWEQVSDEHAVRIRCSLESGRYGVKTKSVSRDLMRDALMLAADEHKFDSAIEWGATLKWDGVERVGTMMHRYFGTEDTPYTRSVGMYLMSALAGRMMEPGVKADMVPILIGPQGYGKSTGLTALVPKGLCGTVDLSQSDDNIIRVTRGKLVVEIEELNGLTKRDNESFKALASRQVDEHVPKYREFTVRSPRRFIMVGTSNTEEILRDETGNRRFLPVTVTEKVDVEGIAAVHEQLWAEGIELYKQNGVMFKDAMLLAMGEHDRYMVRDSWEDAISEWLETLDEYGVKYRERGHVGVKEILVNALHFTEKQIKRSDEMRVSSVMKLLGWARKRISTPEGRAWRYVIG